MFFPNINLMYPRIQFCSAGLKVVIWAGQIYVLTDPEFWAGDIVEAQEPWLCKRSV